MDGHRSRRRRVVATLSALAAAGLAVTAGLTAPLSASAEPSANTSVGISDSTLLEVARASNVEMTGSTLDFSTAQPGMRVRGNFNLRPTTTDNSWIVFKDFDGGDEIRVDYAGFVPTCTSIEYSCLRDTVYASDGPLQFLEIPPKRTSFGVALTADWPMLVTSITGLAPVDSSGNRVTVGTRYTFPSGPWAWSNKKGNETVLTLTSDGGATLTLRVAGRPWNDLLLNCSATFPLTCTADRYGGIIIGYPASVVPLTIAFKADAILTLASWTPGLVPVKSGRPAGIGDRFQSPTSATFGIEEDSRLSFSDPLGNLVSVGADETCDLAQAPSYECATVDGALALSNKTAQFFVDSGSGPLVVADFSRTWVPKRFGAKPLVGKTVEGGAYRVPDVRGPLGNSTSFITFKSPDGAKEVKVVMDPVGGLSCVTTTFTCTIDNNAVQLKLK